MPKEACSVPMYLSWLNCCWAPASLHCHVERQLPPLSPSWIMSTSGIEAAAAGGAASLRLEQEIGKRKLALGQEGLGCTCKTEQCSCKNPSLNPVCVTTTNNCWEPHSETGLPNTSAVYNSTPPNVNMRSVLKQCREKDACTCYCGKGVSESRPPAASLLCSPYAPSSLQWCLKTTSRW